MQVRNYSDVTRDSHAPGEGSGRAARRHRGVLLSGAIWPCATAQAHVHVKGD